MGVPVVPVGVAGLMRYRARSVSTPVTKPQPCLLASGSSCSPAKIDEAVPENLEVHVVCDNYGTHKAPTIRAWLGRHPRFHMHHPPTYSSWILDKLGRLLQRTNGEGH